MSFFDIIPEYVATKKFVVTDVFDQTITVLKNVEISNTEPTTIFEFIAPMNGELNIILSHLAESSRTTELVIYSDDLRTDYRVLQATSATIKISVSSGSTYKCKIENLPENKILKINKLSIVTSVLDNIDFYISESRE